MKRIITTKDFVLNATKIHFNKYCYDKFVYINNHTKGIIICNKCHAEFLQTSNSHISRKNGCPSCAGVKRSNILQFIAAAEKIHESKYDYSKFIYTNNSSPSMIICKINNHGGFLQSPNNHLNNHGCPKCKIDIIKDALTDTLKEFIIKANTIHGSAYSYHKSIYITCMKKIVIVCNKCNLEFLQTPNSHLRGDGCPQCSHTTSKSEIKFLNYLKIPNTKEHRQRRISTKKVDGYDPVTNTIYEFLGDYWHGNPIKYKPEYINQRCKQTAGDLYKSTINKFDTLKSLGFNVKYIWETDWKRFIREIDREPKIITY